MTFDDVATGWTSPRVPPGDDSRADVVTGRNLDMEVLPGLARRGAGADTPPRAAHCRGPPGSVSSPAVTGTCHPRADFAHPASPAASNTGIDATVLEVSPRTTFIGYSIRHFLCLWLFLLNRDLFAIHHNVLT